MAQVVRHAGEIGSRRWPDLTRKGLVAMAFFARNVDPVLEKARYLKQFGASDLEILTPYRGGIEEIPQSWERLLRQGPEQRVAATLQLWDEVVHTQLSKTMTYLGAHLADVELLRVGTAYCLLYSVTNAQGVLRYYVGGNPLRPDFGNNKSLSAQWSQLPASLRTFYEDLHDGFYEFSSRSCGLDALANVVRMADLDWGITAQLGLDLQIDLTSSYAFFNNGGGAYVVIDLANAADGQATLWWSNAAPRYGMDFWELVDDWTVIGIGG